MLTSSLTEHDSSCLKVKQSVQNIL